MTKTEVIAIARDVGMCGMRTDVACTIDELERFAALLVGAERAMRAAQPVSTMIGEQAELRRLSGCCPELNLSNYGPDDVDELNGWAIEVSQCIDRALAAQPAPQPVAREPLTDEQIKALMQARRTAMLMTCKARVPECGEFAAIAQDLDWLCESFGIKGGQHGTE